ncbi:hypothetical protein [Streptomyces sp. AC512_CC834]|uniref:hypothetical protein n=1 Tax=Streptomyces sp. AC512_CC834 TaxID=2823691 RepID=UPI001C26C526|nr:hypothetical protein [Streptomyces sp. AC512_CC834]
MRSARMLLTTAAASAVFVLGAPGAYAAAGGDWDHDDSSYSKEHDNGGKHEEPRGGMHTGGGALAAVSEGDRGHDDTSSGKEHDNGGKHEEPRGGMHTGGGALAAVSEGDWDGGGESKEGSETYKQDEGGKSSGSGEHEKPRGGMHTGGGGLDTPATTAGGLAVLAVAATGLYAVRRKKSAHGMA